MHEFSPSHTLTRQSGFTLVELLVAVGIIGVLASVTIVSVNSVRAKARDAKRIQDVKILAAAIDQYADQNPVFELAGCTRGSVTQNCTIPSDFPLQTFTSIKDSLGISACGRKNPLTIPCQFSIGSEKANENYEICFGLESGVSSIGSAGLYRAVSGGQILSDCSYVIQ